MIKILIALLISAGAYAQCTLTLNPKTRILECAGSGGGGGGGGNVTAAGNLDANLPVIGGGAASVATGTRSGNTTVFVTTTGPQTSGDCVEIDADGNYIASGAPCGGGGGTGDVVGPASSTDNAIARYDSTTGKLLQNSAVTIDDSGNIVTAGSITSGSGGGSAGYIELGQGTAPTAGTTSVKLYGGSAITSYIMRVPSAAGTGFLLGTNTAGDVVQTFVPFTGTGDVVRATSPTLVTPALGTPSALVATNATGTAAGLTAGTATSVPVSAGAAPTTNGQIAYDSTANMLKAAQSGADAYIPQATITPANNDCIKWVVSGSQYKLGSAGAACGTSSAINRQMTLVVVDPSSTGTKSCSVVEVAGTIVAAHLISNALPTGANLVVDVLKVAYASYTGAGSASSITASAVPTITTGAANPRYEDTTLTGWTTSVSANDVVCVAINTAPSGGATWASLSLEVQ